MAGENAVQPASGHKRRVSTDDQRLKEILERKSRKQNVLAENICWQGRDAIWTFVEELLDCDTERLAVLRDRIQDDSRCSVEGDCLVAPENWRSE
jgi:hypothetical protein